MKVIELHSDVNALGPLFECVDGYFNFSNILFGGGGFHDSDVCKLRYSPVKLYVHDDSMY